MDLIETVTGLPKWARLTIAGVAGALLIWGGISLWLRAHDKGVAEGDRNAANVEATTTARKADEGAHAASRGKSDEVQHGNENARKAADDSDDPLASGLHSLRHNATH